MKDKDGVKVAFVCLTLGEVEKVVISDAFSLAFC